MDTLPIEILSAIVQSLAGDTSNKFSTYATVSRAWQAVVEQQTFRSLKIKTRDFDAFEALFASKNVHRAHNCINLEVDFGYKPSEHQQQDGHPPLSDTDAFSQSVARFFDILSDIDSRTTNLPAMTLKVGMRNCNDFNAFDLHLPEDGLPACHQVGTFEFDCSGKLAHLRRTAAFAMLSKLPKVHKANLSAWDNLRWGARERRARRQELCEAISSTANMADLKILILWVGTDMIGNEDRTPGYLLLSPSSSESDGTDNDKQLAKIDPYNRILHDLSTWPSITSLYLVGPLVISPYIFTNLPTFPFLAEFQLEFATETADGRWFFVKDDVLSQKIAAERRARGEDSEEEEYVEPHSGLTDSDLDDDDDDDDEEEEEDEEGPWYQSPHCSNHYRTLPNHATVTPLLLGAAHFVQTQNANTNHKLRRFLLRHQNMHGGGLMFWNHEGMARHLEVWFLKSGTPRCDKGTVKIAQERDFLNEDRLFWRTAAWRPEGEVRKAWRGAIGEGAREFWLSEDGWDPKTRTRPVYVGDLKEEELEK